MHRALSLPNPWCKAVALLLRSCFQREKNTQNGEKRLAAWLFLAFSPLPLRLVCESLISKIPGFHDVVVVVVVVVDDVVVDRSERFSRGGGPF